MTQEEKEGNRIIAEFMGGTLSKPRNPINAPYWKIPGHHTQAGNGEKVYHLYYDRFWDWLMPVVEKIERELGYSCFIFFDEDGFQVQVWKELLSYRKKKAEDIIVSTQSRSKIESVFQAVVQFINWYNQNK